MKKEEIISAVLVAAFFFCIVSCGTHRKLTKLLSGQADNMEIALTNDPDFLPEIPEGTMPANDTLTVMDDDGREMIIMKAIKDEETGEMVATEQLAAAKVTARFRNVAERNGKVNLEFQIIIPSSMRDSKWQLRLYPDMFVLEDSIRLDPVLITGSAYRKLQLRGYQMYDKFLSKIVQDSTKFINVRQLEIFLKRYIPQVFAFKTDSTYVSEQEFYSAYGVSERQAIDHYTNKFSKNLNERRKAKINKKYRKYVKAPIVSEGIRLDTIMVSENGDFIYNYVQQINSMPRLRKVDIVLSGEIFEQEKCIYRIPSCPPLTFYISSISAFVDDREHYITKVIERRAEANTESRIDFPVGKFDIDPEYGKNPEEIALTKNTLNSLINNQHFDLDSIIVSATASPEGSLAANASLAKKRSDAVSSFFGKYLEECRDSLINSMGVFATIGNEEFTDASDSIVKIEMKARCIPENWSDLETLISQDIVMNDSQKEEFFDVCEKYNDLDARETALKRTGFYNYMKSTLYPKLRTVKFHFYLHRKGMIKDTVHTTVIDSTYMQGVQALKDMDYATALVLLQPYQDFNTAVANIGMDKNASALKILLKLEDCDKVNYLLAILYARRGENQKAVQHYLKSCRQNPSYVFRGNLDPEIFSLIKTYGLNSMEEDEVFK